MIVGDGTEIRYAYDREREVEPRELQDRFNEGYYWDQAEIEHVFEQAVDYSAPAPADAGQPSDTLSQIIYYHLDHLFVACVHQYLLPGEQRDDLGRPLLGGTGRMPDPKELCEDDILYWRRPRRRPRLFGKL